MQALARYAVSIHSAAENDFITRKREKSKHKQRSHVRNAFSRIRDRRCYYVARDGPRLASIAVFDADRDGTKHTNAVLMNL